MRIIKVPRLNKYGKVKKHRVSFIDDTTGEKITYWEPWYESINIEEEESEEMPF